MKEILEHLPELEGEESQYVSRLIETLPDDDKRLFATVYRSRRRDPVLVLILALVGFFGVAGIHRFLSGLSGVGILYLLTLGLCFIRTIVDLINYHRIAFAYNRKVAISFIAQMKLVEQSGRIPVRS